MPAWLIHNHGCCLPHSVRTHHSLTPQKCAFLPCSILTGATDFVCYSFVARHEKALEAITICGEQEARRRFNRIVDGIHTDHTALKVRGHTQMVLQPVPGDQNLIGRIRHQTWLFFLPICLRGWDRFSRLVVALSDLLSVPLGCLCPDDQRTCEHSWWTGLQITPEEWVHPRGTLWGYTGGLWCGVVIDVDLLLKVGIC